MARETVTDLIALLAVARERNFTRAAAQLGVSQPALSRTIRALEARLGVRLLTRSTRSVALTEAGERLVQTVGPHFDGIDAGLAALTAMREKPAGSLRISSVEHASETILAPAKFVAGPGQRAHRGLRLSQPVAATSSASVASVCTAVSDCVLGSTASRISGSNP